MRSDPKIHRLLRSTFLVLVLGMVSVFVPGCNILVPVTYAVQGTGQNPAEHELDEVKTLVFVDDLNSVLPRTVLRVRLAESISQELMSLDLVPSTVNPSDVMALVRSRERKSSRSSMSSIAEDAGVSQMIYIKVESFSGLVRSTELRPTASIGIRVMHFDKGGRVYPATEMNSTGSRSVDVSLREIDPSKLRSASDRRRVEQELIAKLAYEACKLFREHEARELGENLGIK
jgi:hypothetical protein